MALPTQHPQALLFALLLATGSLHAQPEIDYERMLSDVEEAASLVDTGLDELSTALEANIGSQAEIDARFEKLTQMLDQVDGKIGESSDNWSMVEQAIEQADSERQAMLDKYTQTRDADYQEYADAWAEMKQRLIDVRQGLLDERTEMEGLKAELAQSRDKITQLIKLQRAEAAAQKLEQVRDRLAAMNDTMRSLVESTRQVQAGMPN
jgi:DNA repair exonuclease SbcCD ATPase subunit